MNKRIDVIQAIIEPAIQKWGDIFRTKDSLGAEAADQLFMGPSGITDLKWSLKLIEDLEGTVVRDIYKAYLQKRKAEQGGTARTANTWLRERVQWFREMLSSFPVPLHMIRNEESRLAVADDWARQTRNILNAATNQQTESQDPEQLFNLMREPADLWGFVPKMPSDSDDKSRLEWIADVLVRFIDEEWWARKINRAWDRYTEHAAILTGKVRRGVSPYISNRNLNIYRTRKAAAKRWMQQMLVVNPEYQIEISLEDAVNSSVSNPKNRRHELMVRMRGFEDLASEMNYIGLFVTWTSPSKYHSWKQASNGRVVENKKYKGSMPHETQKYLCKLWSRCRAEMARKDIRVFGFRVAEPHHDGTPHWHMLVFVHPDQLCELISIMQRYALTDDKDELVRTRTSFMKTCPAFTDISARFDWKIMDPQEGGATGYIAKYIAKNLDGHAVGDDWEAETPAEEGAVSAGAWSCWHGIRQFQQIGGPGVSVWRELRRLKEPEGPSRDQVLEHIRHAADKGNWRGYVSLMGGPVLPRAERPVHLFNIVKESASKYGEDIKKIMGVFGLIETRQSRLDGWELSRHGLDERERLGSIDRQGDAVTGQAEGAAPWSSDNNCTINEISRADQKLAEHFERLDLDYWEITKLKEGCILKHCGQYIRIRNGMLLVSDHHPTMQGVLDPIDVQFENELKKETSKRLKMEAWQVLENGLDIYKWLEPMREQDQDVALEHINKFLYDMELEEEWLENAAKYGNRYMLR